MAEFCTREAEREGERSPGCLLQRQAVIGYVKTWKNQRCIPQKEVGDEVRGGGHQTLDSNETSKGTAIMDHFIQKSKGTPSPSVAVSTSLHPW